MTELSLERRPVRIANADGLALVADEWGTPGAPSVLLLHGGGQNRYAWTSTAERLCQAGYFVLAVDARGHGDSDWDPEARYDMDDMGRDVHEVLDRFDRPPAVVGASMGGMASIIAQNQAPERQLFSSVTLVDVTPRMEIDGVLRIMAFMTANPHGFERLEDAAAAIAAYNPHRPPPRSTDGLRKVLRQREDGRWHWLWDPRFMMSKPGAVGGNRELTEQRMAEMAERLHKAASLLTVPTLLVRGALSDLVSEQSVAELLEAVPHARYVDVSHAGHMVAGDNNETFAVEILEFLSSAHPAG
jgi:pimeloyl-ACP methyl ester carboxylesterase